VPHAHPESTEAIGLSLYESLPSTTAEQVGTEVVRTQWLDFSTLGAAGAAGMLGKKILIVDEVDDTCVPLR
jgi:hypoxanthine phosphoribosyltransferase